jgi:hypothetical protein
MSPASMLGAVGGWLSTTCGSSGPALPHPLWGEEEAGAPGRIRTRDHLIRSPRPARPPSAPISCSTEPPERLGFGRNPGESGARLPDESDAHARCRLSLMLVARYARRHMHTARASVTNSVTRALTSALASGPWSSWRPGWAATNASVAGEENLVSTVMGAPLDRRAEPPDRSFSPRRSVRTTLTD